MSFFRKRREPIARTLVEAELHLRLHPCSCGKYDQPDASERSGVLWYDGPCPSCGKKREDPFGVPMEAPAFGTAWETFYGGPHPSMLIDAGEWLDMSRRLSNQIIPDATAQSSAVEQYVESITLATAQLTEVLKFIDGRGGRATPPPAAYWTAAGRAAAAREPSGSLQRDRLKAYRYGMSEDMRTRFGGRYRGVRITGKIERPY